MPPWKSCVGNKAFSLFRGCVTESCPLRVGFNRLLPCAPVALDPGFELDEMQRVVVGVEHRAVREAGPVVGVGPAVLPNRVNGQPFDHHKVREFARHFVSQVVEVPILKLGVRAVDVLKQLTDFYVVLWPTWDRGVAIAATIDPCGIGISMRVEIGAVGLEVLRRAPEVFFNRGVAALRCRACSATPAAGRQPVRLR